MLSLAGVDVKSPRATGVPFAARATTTPSSAKIDYSCGHTLLRGHLHERHRCSSVLSLSSVLACPSSLSPSQRSEPSRLARPAAWPAAGASGRVHACVPRLSVLPRESPTLAAAEGHLSTDPSDPSWRVGRKVGEAPSTLSSVGRLSQGQQWPMCAHLVPRLLWCAPLSERGVVQHRGSKSWQQHERVWLLQRGTGHPNPTAVQWVAAQWQQSCNGRATASCCIGTCICIS